MGFVEPVRFTWTTQSDGRRKKTPLRGTRWKARYRDSDGRARSRTFPTKTEAQNYLGRTSADIQRGDYIDPLERRRKFSDWAEVWWQTTIKLRPTTRRGYWQLLHGHVLPTFGARAVSGIDHLDVEQFIAAKLVEGLSVARKCVGLGASEDSCNPVKVTRPELPIEGAASSVLRSDDWTFTSVPPSVGVSVISMHAGVDVALSVLSWSHPITRRCGGSTSM